MSARGNPPTVPLPVLLGHHVVAGAAVLVPWLALAPPAARAGVPPVVVLLGVVGAVLPVVARGFLRRQLASEGLRRADAGSGDGGRWDARLVRERLGLRRPTRREVVRRGAPAVLVALVLPAAGLPVEAAVRRAGWFSVLPPTGPPDLSSGSGTSPLAAAGVLLAWVAVVLGPVVEEVLFRGLLQPLLPGGPWGRVLGGSALFAVYHLWQPGAWLTVWLATLPAAWVRERTGSTWMAAGVHVVVNAVALALLLAQVVRR